MKLESFEVQKTSDFVYDSPLWGMGTISKEEKSILGRKLSYCLEDLTGVQGRILEVGCARGQFIRSIKKYRSDLEAFGCDVNQAAIQLNQEESDGVFYCVGDGLRLPFPEGFFDAVVMFDLLEHVEAPEKFLSEVRRVLKRGGLCHGYIPCEGQPGTLYWLLWKLRLGHNLKKKHRGHIHRFRLQECASLLEPAGFVPTRIRYSGYFLEQLLDISFYVSLEFKGLRDTIWQAHASKSIPKGRDPKKSFLTRSLAMVKDVAYQLSYYETKVLAPLKGLGAMGLHVTAKKE